MTATVIADTSVDVDAEGFLTHADQWNEQIAEQIARENGIRELSERHWLVVKFMRERYLTTATHPRSARWARSRAYRSRSSISSSPKARPSSRPRSAASPSPAAASRKERTR
jgi:TusE/DsrC/DsvC family sulfur relay protein